MHTASATKKRQINRGAALNGSARFIETGQGKGARTRAQSFDSGVPQNATSFMTKHSGNSMSKNSAVICQFGESAARLMQWLTLASTAAKDDSLNSATEAMFRRM